MYGWLSTRYFGHLPKAVTRPGTMISLSCALEFRRYRWVPAARPAPLRLADMRRGERLSRRGARAFRGSVPGSARLSLTQVS